MHRLLALLILTLALPEFALAETQSVDAYADDYSFYIGHNGSSVERLRLEPNGNIGLSVPAPTTRLEVAGTVSATLFSLALTQVTNNCGSIALGAVCTASCAGSQKVLNGGCTTGGGALTSSRPLPDVSGWSCTHGALLGNTVTAVATCANIQ